MLSRSECFKILGLDESAGPNAIKRSYRKLAFELHPDLNPDLPEASKRFQQLNEAYVMLMQEYANTSFAAGKKSGAGSASARRQRPGAGDAGADEKVRAEARRAYEKASRAQNSGTTGAAGAQTQQGRSQSAGQGGQNGGSAGAYQDAGTYQGGREEILRDLLQDPFARRVFEDIYSHVRYNAGKGAKQSKQPPVPPKPAPKGKIKAKAKPARKSPLEAVGGKMAELAGGIRGWLRKQIDDEQTMFMPGESLYPGARLRLQVQHGFSGNKRTIEITLPPEFAPGKPIRLKGLGRRVGSMQGDLYLRIYSNDEEE